MVIGGVVTPKDKAAEARLLANTTLKRNLLSCLIKQNIRCIVFKYFLTATYYCSIIAVITREKSCSIIADCRDEQLLQKKKYLLKDVLVLKINLMKTLCLVLEAETR